MDNDNWYVPFNFSMWRSFAKAFLGAYSYSCADSKTRHKLNEDNTKTNVIRMCVAVLLNVTSCAMAF